MDFGEVLQTAKQNGSSKPQIQYYSTKFAPPKKEQRNKTMSVNVQKFLARKEAEERQKMEEARRRKEKLLELRSHDKKATRRVNVMLKRTKSANKAVIEDARDADNTAVTLIGPSQPDEDDYGYVSKESEALYNKMMEKYSKMPEESKFGPEKRRVSTNLNSTKEKVMAALERERLEASLPHRRKRKHEGEKLNELERNSPLYEDDKKKEGQKTKFKPAPPVNFDDLLKLAAKKQHEPIIIEPKKVEEERLLTKKQKREIEKEKEWRERKESRGKPENRNLPPSKPHQQKINGEKTLSSTNTNDKMVKKPDFKVPTVKPTLPSNQPKSMLEKNPMVKRDRREEDKRDRREEDKREKMDYQREKMDYQREKIDYQREKISQKMVNEKNGVLMKKSNLPSFNKNGEHKIDKSYDKNYDKKPIQGIQKRPSDSNGFKDVRNRNGLSEVRSKDYSTKDYPSKDYSTKDYPSKDYPTKDLSPKGYPTKDFPPKDLLKPKQFPPKDLKPKQFPPPDVRKKQFPPKEVKRKPLVANKGRILDDDDEEYDSEMDDFIDDGPEEQEDYSSVIRQIFGYDKRKYKHVEEEDDTDNMESTFAQQMKEECISTKIGIQEDLEDMKREEEEKKLKAQRLKKLRRQ